MHYLSYFLGKNVFGDDDFPKCIFKYVCLSTNIQYVRVKERQRH